MIEKTDRKKWVMRLNQLFNVLSIFALLVLVYLYSKNFISTLEWKDRAISSQYQLLKTDGSQLTWPLSQSHIVVFWAVWCAPCSLELSRLNDMVSEGSLDAKKIIAIHTESHADLQKIKLERQYKFELYHSVDAQIFSDFHIDSTPTTFWVSEDQMTRWRSSGVTPFLSIYNSIFL